MKRFVLLSLTTLALCTAATSSAWAGASGVQFSPEEIAANAMNAQKIADTAQACLVRHWNTHTSFHKARGYSKFYGNRNPKYKTPELRKAALMSLLPELAKKVKKGDPAAIEELNKREAELTDISCIGLALNCTGEGFKAAGMEATWQKIWAWIGRPGPDGTPLFYGTDLQKALVDLGWKSIYWNPDVSRNDEWDQLERAFNPLQEGKEWNPVWGGHTERWTSVMRKHTYFGIPVHDIRTLVNFGITPQNNEFKQVPFYVGTAHAGYHVFPGFKGQVIEAHSMRELRSSQNLEVGMFNPLYQPVNGVEGGNGAPRWTKSEHYRSGVIVVPPGFIADKPFTVPPAAVNTPPDGTIPPNNGEPGWNEPNDPWRRPQPPRRRDCWFVFCR